MTHTHVHAAAAAAAAQSNPRYSAAAFQCEEVDLFIYAKVLGEWVGSASGAPAPSSSSTGRALN